MTIRELQIKRAAKLDERKALHEKAVEEGRDFTEEEQGQFDALKAEADAIQTQIDRAQTIDDEQTALDVMPPRQIYADGLTKGAVGRISVGANRLAEDPTGGYGENGFGQFARDVYLSKDPTSAPERLRSWVRASHESAFAAGDGMNSSIGSEGAFLVPPQFGSLIDKIALENAIIRPRAQRIPMSSKSIQLPVLDDTTHATGTVFGGVQAYFKSEEAQLTSSKPAFAEMTLTVHKLTTLAYVSGEMLDFSPISLDSWLPNKLAQAMTWKEEDKFVNGTGAAGEPIGILNSACAIAVSAEAGQAADTIVTENLIKMMARAWRLGSNLVWIANRTCETQLPLLTVGTGAAGMPVYLPPNGLAGVPLATMMGIPILYTEHARALGDAGDIVLCNVGEYLVGDASGKTRADRNIGLKFDYDQVAFRVITYTGGMMPWRSAFTPQYGSTLSPVVTLAERT